MLNYLSDQACDHVCYELFQGSPMQGRKCSWVGTAWKIPNTACEDWQSDLLSSVALHRGHIAPALCLPHREEICVSSPVSSTANWPLSDHEHPVRGPQLMVCGGLWGVIARNDLVQGCVCATAGLPTCYWKIPPGLARLRLADFKSAFLQSL